MSVIIRIDPPQMESPESECQSYPDHMSQKLCLRSYVLVNHRTIHGIAVNWWNGVKEEVDGCSDSPDSILLRLLYPKFRKPLQGLATSIDEMETTSYDLEKALKPRVLCSTRAVLVQCSCSTFTCNPKWHRQLLRLRQKNPAIFNSRERCHHPDTELVCRCHLAPLASNANECSEGISFLCPIVHHCPCSEISRSSFMATPVSRCPCTTCSLLHFYCHREQ